MACMEHRCVNRDCDWVAFDNSRHGPGFCPKCGGDVRTEFDEPPEREYDARDEWDEAPDGDEE